MRVSADSGDISQPEAQDLDSIQAILEKTIEGKFTTPRPHIENGTVISTSEERYFSV
jgi:hypothetical protein